MTLRFQGWKRRFLGLGAGVLLCASTGCVSDKEERRIGQGPAPINKPMGPGNTVVSPPTSPAFNNLANNGPGFVSPPPLGPTAVNQTAAMPMMPSGPNRANTMPMVNQPVNTSMNPASFSNSSPNSTLVMPAQGVQASYSLQQPMPGMPQPQAPAMMQSNPQAMQVQMPPMPQQSMNQPQNLPVASSMNQPQGMQVPHSMNQPQGMQAPNSMSQPQSIPVQPPMMPQNYQPQTPMHMPQQQQMIQYQQGMPMPQQQSGQQTVPQNYGNYQQPQIQMMPAPAPQAQPLPLMPPSNLSSRTPDRLPASVTASAPANGRTGVVQASASMPDPYQAPSAKVVASYPIRQPNDPSLVLPPTDDVIESAPVTYVGR